MTGLQGLFAAIAAIVLFLYGLHGFSQELQAVGGDKLRAWLGRVTASRWRGFMIGASTTAVVQSSSAVTSLAVALVDSGAITFRGSLGVLLGANVGTTATAWLVSFKLTGIGPFFIVLGAAISVLPWRIKIFGKAIFFFGFIFFALELISITLKPLQEKPEFQEWLAMAQVPWKGVLAGLVFTALVQSSSVTTGVAILLVQQNILPPEAAIPLVVGANVGTTSTALLASLGMKPMARATAVSNFLFNFAGMLLFFPFLVPFSNGLVALVDDPGMAVAWAHLIFNLIISGIFLCTMDWIEPRLMRWLASSVEEETAVSPPDTSTA
jgi:Na/Pi-cotransporter